MSDDYALHSSECLALKSHNDKGQCRDCRPGDSEGMCSEMSRLYAAYLRKLASLRGIDPDMFPGVRSHMRRNGTEPKPLTNLYQPNNPASPVGTPDAPKTSQED